LCLSSLERTLVAVKDVAAFLTYCRSSSVLKMFEQTRMTVAMLIQRDIKCFHELAGRIERFGLSILLPTKPHSFHDGELFLDIVYELYWICEKSKIEPHLQRLLCRDELYINMLASHLHICNSAPICFTTHILMARYVARYVNSNSALFVLNSGFLQAVVKAVSTRRQHLMLFAVEALIPLLCVGKKHRKKILKKLSSVEIGFGLVISNILRQYATHGFRKMQKCNCLTSSTTSQDCATQCIERLYQVISILGKF